MDNFADSLLCFLLVIGLAIFLALTMTAMHIIMKEYFNTEDKDEDGKEEKDET